MDGLSVVYIHIGTDLPEYLYSSLYQVLLVNENGVRVYVILSDDLISKFNDEFNNFNLEYYTKNKFYYKNLVQVVPLSLLEMYGINNNNFTNYKNVISNKFTNLSGFRDGFWISTTSRFFYLCIFMEMFSIKDVFHIEGDIMMFSSFTYIYNEIINRNFNTSGNIKIDKICMVEDAPGRVIPSILFFPDQFCLSNLTQFITNELLSSDVFMNDMDILGKYNDKYNLQTIPDGDSLLFDGAALGQYLGGVDYRNLKINETDRDLMIYNNPSRGFINETACIKAKDYEFVSVKTIFDNLRVPLKIPVLYDINKISQIANLHIHSKQLYQFSSVSNLLFDDIISGDRILGLCDFVLSTPEIYNFHKNIEKYAKDVIIVKDFENVNMVLLNKYFKESCILRGVKYVKLFIYTHMLDNFQKHIFPHLNKDIKYILYFHNSDHSVNDSHLEILESDIIEKIYAQNIDTSIDSDKITLLPIGMANSMWKHGDLMELYKTISKTYYKKKQNSIYVNINPNTYSYRKDVLEKIKTHSSFILSDPKPYNEYLLELSKSYFCLCLRGNGIDTHRFWESLYLGVIPVVINNKTTLCENFLRYVRKLDVPFYEIKGDDLDYVFKKYNGDFFNQILYKNIITNCKSSVYNLDCLRISFYEYEKCL